MQKLLVTVTVLLAALAVGLIVGCDENNPSPVIPRGDEVARIELHVTNNALIQGFVGEERQETITATALNSSGVGVPNVVVTFGIQNQEDYKGHLALASGDSSKTNTNGEITAAYSVVLQRSTPVVIMASSGNVTQTKTITIQIVDDIIGSIDIVGPSVLTVPPNETITAVVTAHLADLGGNDISGIQVHFRTSPANLGSVDSEAGITDANGSVSKIFRTSANVNTSSVCKVFAWVGQHIDSVAIEISPRAEAYAISITTETPLVKVVPNQNAKVEILAVVTTESGNGVPRATVSFAIEPVISGGSIFGSLTPTDTTDANGEVRTTFSSLGEDGDLIIRATVLPSSGLYSIPEGEVQPGMNNSSGKGKSGIAGADDDEVITDEMELTIELLTKEIGRLTLQVIPSYLSLPPDSTGNAMVLSRVVDWNQEGIANLQVNFDCDDGTLAKPTLTDSTGLATAEYCITPRTDFPNPEDVSIVDSIRAEIPETRAELRKTVGITVEKSASDEGDLDLTTDVNHIYADRGLTVAHLEAVLKDANNQVLAGREVIFTSTYGAVNSPVITDSLGIARAVFTDIGVPSLDDLGNSIPALVTALYNPMSLESSVEITILERNPVDHITLQAAQARTQAGSQDSIWVGATCILSNNDFASAGQLVYFEVNLGRFISDAVPVTGNFGQAENYYIADPRVGTATLRAYVVNVDSSIVYSNELEIVLFAGPPVRITVDAEPNNLQTNDPAQYSVITATVLDTVGNHVGDGILVTFDATLGSLDHISAATDENGQAVVRLAPGVTSGVAVITATVNTAGGQITGQTTVVIRSANPNSIQLEADPSAIAVQGAGGNSSSTLQALLYDANHNLVEVPSTVFFQLLNEPGPPAGCNINDHGMMDSSITSGGIATATLNSGTLSGTKLLRAYTLINNPEDPEVPDTISVTISRVQVLSGPPDQIDIDVNNTGEDGGAGVWVIEANARVYDEYRNPVEDGIPVWFTCDSVASIGDAVTGNESRNGSVEKGIAYAVYQYNSNNTFDTLMIHAKVRVAERMIEDSLKHQLPLQDGILVLHCAPENWAIDAPNMGLANIHCLAQLRDNHEVLINNAPILFTANRAYFYWYNHYREPRYRLYDLLAEPPEPAIKYTGWHIDNGHREHRENPGEATVYMRGTEWDFFLDDVSPEMNVQISAQVVGYEDVIADPVIVIITRHPGP